MVVRSKFGDKPTMLLKIDKIDPVFFLYPWSTLYYLTYPNLTNRKNDTSYLKKVEPEYISILEMCKCL